MKTLNVNQMNELNKLSELPTAQVSDIESVIELVSSETWSNVNVVKTYVKTQSLRSQVYYECLEELDNKFATGKIKLEQFLNSVKNIENEWNRVN